MWYAVLIDFTNFFNLLVWSDSVTTPYVFLEIAFLRLLWLVSLFITVLFFFIDTLAAKLLLVNQFSIFNNLLYLPVESINITFFFFSPNKKNNLKSLV